MASFSDGYILFNQWFNKYLILCSDNWVHLEFEGAKVMVRAQICEIFINIIAVIHLNFVVLELLEVPADDHFCDEVGV